MKKLGVSLLKMIFKITKYGYRTPEEDMIELVVEDTCGNEFQGLLKLNKELKE